MPKATNERRIATAEQRAQADRIYKARRYSKEWKTVEEATKEAFAGDLNGDRDITFTTEDGVEVISITESDPSQSVDWPAFRAAHPELKDEIDKFLKPATTSVRIDTKWVEPEEDPNAV